MLKIDMRIPSRFSKAFSLVEVALALGILSFSAVAIMGLLPTGLTAFQKSSNTTASSRLAAEVQSELQQVGLSSFSTNDTSFDIEGRLVIDAQGMTVASTPAIYDVCRTVQICSLPGASASPLKRIVVQVLNNPGRIALQRDANSGLVVVPNSMDECSFEFHVLAP